MTRSRASKRRIWREHTQGKLQVQEEECVICFFDVLSLVYRFTPSMALIAGMRLPYLVRPPSRCYRPSDKAAAGQGTLTFALDLSSSLEDYNK
jgi:hypothetical protein